MKRSKSTENDNSNEYLEGRDWRKLAVIPSKSNRRTYCAICLHCFSFYSNHRSVPKHGKMCPYFNHTTDVQKIKEQRQIDPNKIDKITNHRIFKNHLQYCVKWKGKSNTSNTWEDMDDLSNANLQVKAYWTSIHREDPLTIDEDLQESSDSEADKDDDDDDSSTESEQQDDKDQNATETISHDESEDESADSQAYPDNENESGNNISNHIQQHIESSSIEYAVSEVQTEPALTIESAVYENNQVKWMVDLKGQRKFLTNEEMKEHYLPELVAFYESHLEFS